LEVSGLAYAASLAAASPRWALPANLLPAGQRAVSSRLAYAPTAVLALLLAVAAGLMASQGTFQNERYLNRLNGEVAALEKQALHVQELDQEAAAIQERAAVLDRFRRRSSADVEALRELTALLAPPAWASNLSLSRTEITVTGEAPQAAPQLQILDNSPLFVNSQFGQTLGRQGAGGEAFTIRASREGSGTGDEPQ
jgi:Tfp pilus assembly protein PilN